MSTPSVHPIVTKGKWTAPTVLPSWHQCVRDPMAEPVTGQQLPAQIDVRDYPYVEYWKNVEMEHERMTAQAEQDAMETQAQEDSMGVPLPDRPPVVAVKPKVNVRIVFDEQTSKIEKGFVPLGIINPDGTQFKFVMPPGHMGDQINKRVFAIPFPIRSAAWQRYHKMYEVFIGLSKVLPVPLHTSPLGLLMTREPEPALRWKDAVSTLHGLHVLRHAMHEMDTENQEHKTRWWSPQILFRHLFNRYPPPPRCWAFYKTLEGHVAERFYKELDLLAEEEKAGGATREVAQQVAVKFGDAVSRFALDMVHAVEWCCMDILQLPYEWRYLFMTPNDLPPGTIMNKVAFDQMRTQTIRYVTDRNKVPPHVVSLVFLPFHQSLSPQDLLWPLRR